MDAFCRKINIKPLSLITFKDAMIISSLGCAQECGIFSDYPSYMLSRIMIQDTNSRKYPDTLYKTVDDRYPKETNTIDFLLDHEPDGYTQNSIIHPMDVFIYIFIMSHPTLRQYLVIQLSKCQLSLPLITSNQSNNRPKLYIYALKSLFKDYCASNSISKSISVLEEELVIISFIRIGNCSCSRKSQILNQIIRIPDYFFHKDQLGSVQTRYFLDGTVEMGWIFPKLEERIDEYKTGLNHSNAPYLVLNLRGNAWDYPNQRNYLGEISTLIYLFVPLNQCQCSNDITNDLVSFQKQFKAKSTYLIYKSCDVIVPPKKIL